jgi:dTDP-4-dehydrorhamnose reductase
LKGKKLQRILIIGATGFLGSSLTSNLVGNYQVFGTTNSGTSDSSLNLHHIDGTNDFQVNKLFDNIRPDIVINCAGLTVVDECEARPEATWLLNAVLPGILSDYCAASGSKFVQISTDHFESDSQTSRSEDGVFWAVNQYGYSKLEAERIVLAKNPSALVVRTNFFGTANSTKISLMNWIIGNLESRKKIIGVNDVIFSPVSLNVLARTLDRLIKNDCSGVINVSSNEEVSKYEFACMISSSMNLPQSLVTMGLARDVDLKAKRPSRLALSNRRLTEVLGCEIPSMEDMILEEISEYLNQRQALWSEE